MSIIAFCGLPGSGKSYGVVENVILKAFQDGRHVVTNIPLQRGPIYTAFPDAQLTLIKDIEAELGQVESRTDDGAKCYTAPGFKKLPAGAVIVLDEVWRIWPAGMKADAIAVEAKEFLAEHRHMVGPDGRTTEIVLVVQDLAQCAAFAVRLVEKTYISRKHNELGMKGRYVVGIFAGAVKGLKGPAGRELGVIQGAYSEKVWKFYQSHTKAEGGVVGNEQAADRRGVVWKRPLVMFGLPLAVLGLMGGVYGIKAGFAKLTGAESEEIQNVTESQTIGQPSGATYHDHVPGLVVPAAAQAAAVDSVSAAAVVEPQYSTVWRVAAIIANEDGSGVAMIAAGKRQRRIPFEDCYQAIGQEWECRLDGELVTTWSGREPSNLAERLVAGPTRALGYEH